MAKCLVDLRRHGRTFPCGLGSTPVCQGVLEVLYRTRLNMTRYSHLANFNQLEAISFKLSFLFTNNPERLQSRTKRACSAPKSKTGICEKRHCPVSKSEGSRARFFSSLQQQHRLTAAVLKHRLTRRASTEHFPSDLKGSRLHSLASLPV